MAPTRRPQVVLFVLALLLPLLPHVDGSHVSSALAVAPTANSLLATATFSVTEQANWTLDWGDGTTPDSANNAKGKVTVSHTYAQKGTYTVTLFTKQKSGNSAVETSTASVTVDRHPVFTSPTSPVAATEGVPLTFDVVASDPDAADGAPVLAVTLKPAAATFDAGNGTFAWTPSGTDAGSHTATFTATSGGATATLDVVVNVADVNTPPTVALDVSPLTGTAPLEVTFDPTGTTDPDGSIESWALTLGADSVLSGTGPPTTRTYTYYTAGTHQVALNVTDDAGAWRVAYENVTVTGSVANIPPRIELTAQPVDARTAQVTVRATDPDGTDPEDYVTWTLDWGDGSALEEFNTTSATERSHGYDDPGTYTITVNATDSEGAYRVASTTVTVRGQWDPTITPSVAAGNGPLSVTFTIDVEDDSGITAVVFDAGFGFDTPLSTAFPLTVGPIRYPADATPYTPTVTVQDAFGVSEWDATTVDSNPAPSVTLTASAQDLDVTFSIAATDDDAITWTLETGELDAAAVTGSGTSEAVRYGGEGTYTACVTVDDGLATASDCVDVTVQAPVPSRRSGGGGGGGGGGSRSPDVVATSRDGEADFGARSPVRSVAADGIEDGTRFTYAPLQDASSLLAFSLTPTRAGETVDVGPATIRFAIRARDVPEPQRVVLLHGEDRDPLPTDHLRTESGYALFEAVTPGFSPFYAVLDEDVPTIEPPAEANLSRAATLLRFHFADKVGVARANATVDDLPDVRVRVDLAEGRLDLVGPFPSGPHTVNVTVEDHAGHNVSLEWTFHVAAPREEAAPDEALRAAAVPAPAPPPRVPADVAGLQVVPGHRRVHIAWTPDPDASEYRVYRATAAGELELVATVFEAAYTDTNVTNGHRYWYAVRTFEGERAGAWSPTVDAVPHVAHWLRDHNVFVGVAFGMVQAAGLAFVAAQWAPQVARAIRQPRVKGGRAEVPLADLRCDLCLGAFKTQAMLHACACGVRLHGSCYVRAGACPGCASTEGLEVA